MPLTSPRFRNERELIAIEANRAVMRRGSHGRHVHLVQMALIDLSFPMPISTKSNDYSPDGVFGTETESVVKAFQRSIPPPGVTFGCHRGREAVPRGLLRLFPRVARSCTVSRRDRPARPHPRSRMRRRSPAARAAAGILRKAASGPG